VFDRIIDLFLTFANLFKFWVILEPYEEGILLRLGKLTGPPLKCGFHWVIPFKIDQVIGQSVVPSTHSLGDESMTTADGKSVGFHAIITYQISDIEKALLKVHDTDHAVRDACSGEIGKVLRESTWSEIMSEGMLEKLTAACRKRGWRWGIEIMSVQLAGLSLVRNIRLMNSSR
jgi:regulator of protease activity HflC (stomatin/prohibitin superfamily)